MNSLESLCSIKFSMHHRCKPKYVYETEKDNFDLIRKDLEVLKLIKEKAVNIGDICSIIALFHSELGPNDEFEIYNTGKRNHLTKEEFDQIKDWLGRE